MKTLIEPTVGELAAKDYRKVEVFKKYGVDFCCGGKKSLSKVCKEKGINQTELERELSQAEISGQLPSQDFNLWELGFLADYIIQTHHKYIIRAMPLIFEYIQKVSKVHGIQNPETIEAATLFTQVMNELNRHMMKEENILFPYIKQLSEQRKSNKSCLQSPFGTVENPIRMMEHEHDIVGELMEKIRKATINYKLPTNACNSFRYAYAKLQEFEADLHQHIHLENNILFPKAIELEQELQG
ncbi:MAG: iron-sulfur cluster repair di-iron protein [Bacteroidetes bacterium]|nr:MAG: iron-sulfur cluster repair di-iron protein [Bacteroidota bacterium]